MTVPWTLPSQEPEHSSSWGDFQKTVFTMRQALEQNYIRSSLQKWVDLVFGHKQ